MTGFEELVAEGEAAPVDGWDFSWFAGRATEARPSWGYSRLMARRMGRAGAALDVQTGAGEVLAEVVRPSWSPRSPGRAASRWPAAGCPGSCWCARPTARLRCGTPPSTSW